MSAMVQVDSTWVRAADVSLIRQDRGHSFTNLIITMRNGQALTHRDWQGSAYRIERELLAAIEAEAAA